MVRAYCLFAEPIKWYYSKFIGLKAENLPKIQLIATFYRLEKNIALNFIKQSLKLNNLLDKSNCGAKKEMHNFPTGSAVTVAVKGN